MTEIKVNNLTFTVQKVDYCTSSDALGICDYVSQTISIMKDLKADNMKSTLIHEVTHAYMWAYGFRDSQFNNETICNIMGAYGEEIINTSNKILKEWEEND